MSQELDFIVDMMEEQLIKGTLRWLASFKEVYRDYALGSFSIPIYAVGSLTEKGFFLSRIFSAFVTPKYKIHFLLYTSDVLSAKSMRELILSCKRKFGSEDWIFITVVQTSRIEKAVRSAVKSLADKQVGLAVYSLAAKDEVSSNNVLGRALKQRLRLTEARFEPLNVPDYLKSITVMFTSGVLLLVLLIIMGTSLNVPLSLLVILAFSIIAAYPLYRRWFHTAFLVNSKGFILWKGQDVAEGKWADFTDISLHITPQHDVHIRLHAQKAVFDIPLSRVGLSRRETYAAIKQRLKKRTD